MKRDFEIPAHLAEPKADPSGFDMMDRLTNQRRVGGARFVMSDAEMYAGMDETGLICDAKLYWVAK